MAGVACQHPQTTYIGLKKSLQQEWDFVQRATLDIGTTFHTEEDDLQDAIISSLFKGDTSQGVVTGLPVKQAEIYLPDPTQTSRASWTASCVITRHLVTALHGATEFRSGGHELLMGEGRDEIRQRHAEDADTALGDAQAKDSKEDDHWMGRNTQMGA